MTGRKTSFRAKYLGTAGAVLIAVFSLLGSLTAQAEPRPRVSMDRAATGFWKTDKAKFLDDDLLRQSLAKAGLMIGDDQPALPEEARKPDLLATDILQLIVSEQTLKQGVHLETVLSTLGALAGFACQMAVREDIVPSGKMPLDKALTVITAKSGEKFYTSAQINDCLASNKNLSVWGFAGGAAERLNEPKPDLSSIFQYTAATLGKPEFGRPDLPAGHGPMYDNEELLWKYWNIVRNHLAIHQQRPVNWPMILGMAAQRLIVAGKNNVNPTLAARIVMSAAIPMSRLNPDRIYAAYLDPAKKNKDTAKPAKGKPAP